MNYRFFLISLFFIHHASALPKWFWYGAGAATGAAVSESHCKDSIEELEEKLKKTQEEKEKLEEELKKQIVKDSKNQGNDTK